MHINFSESFELLFLNVKVKIKNFLEYLKVVSSYYFCFSFAKSDLLLLYYYCFESPFSTSKKFLMKSGEEDIFTYGETPITTLAKIVKRIKISETDCFYDLGSGRGRQCFWLACWVGCRVVGIDFVPEFIDRCNKVKKKCGIKKIEFRCEDLESCNLDGATVIFIYGITFSDKLMKSLIEKIKKLGSFVKIITVSFSLNEFCEKPRFKIVDEFEAKFTWGTATVYAQVLEEN